MKDLMSEGLSTLIADVNDKHQQVSESALNEQKLWDSKIRMPDDLEIPARLLRIKGRSGLVSASFEIDPVMISQIVGKLSIRSISYYPDSDEKTTGIKIEADWEQVWCELEIMQDSAYLHVGSS